MYDRLLANQREGHETLSPGATCSAPINGSKGMDEPIFGFLPKESVKSKVSFAAPASSHRILPHHDNLFDCCRTASAALRHLRLFCTRYFNFVE